MGRRLLSSLVLCVSLWLGACPVGRAQAAGLSFSQLRLTSWTLSDGAPSSARAVVQDGAGFLWLAGPDGVFRFDGVSFERVDSGLDRETYGIPIQLMVGRDGSAWVWYRKRGLAVWTDGRLHFAPNPNVVGTVISVQQTLDGAVWLGVRQRGSPLWRYYSGRWTQLAAPTPHDELVDAMVAADGALWLSYTGSIWRKPPDRATFEQQHAQGLSVPVLAADPQGAVWALSPTGGQRLSGAWGRMTGDRFRPVSWRSAQRSWLNAAFDRDGNLWTQSDVEFGRIDGLAHPDRRPSDVVVHETADTVRMTARRPVALAVDRSGSAWIATSRGLDRLSLPSVVIEPSLTSPTRFGDELLAASSGAVFIGEADGIYRVDPGGDPVRILRTASEPETLCEAPDGSIYAALGDRIMRLHGGRWTALEKPPAESGIYECGFDASGHFWLTAAGSGLYLQEGTQWRKVLPTTGADRFKPIVKWQDPEGQLWVLANGDTMFRLDGAMRESRSLKVDGQNGARAPFSTSRGLLYSGEDGVALFSAAGAVVRTGAAAQSLRNVTGLVQNKRGETWLHNEAGVVRLRTDDLNTFFANDGTVIPHRVYGFEDGLLEGRSPHSWRTMVEGGDGRLWLATVAGIARIDPRNVQVNTAPPGVFVTHLSDGRTDYVDPKMVRLKPGASDISIRFSVLNLTMPERVRVLYRLVGHDKGWVDPGARRQAFYTNLTPGNYRFEVIAANEDGVWNRTGNHLSFTITPTFLQSVWFKLLIGVFLAAVIWATYALRVRQLAAESDARFRVRTVERERIARELHDTLLQGFQGLMLKFQAVSNRMPASEPLGRDIELALDRAEAVIAEGRSRVRDLRNDASGVDLSSALMDAAGDLGGEGPPIEVSIEGEPKPTPALVNEEILRIVDEAVRNALAHADASRIFIRLIFGRLGISLSITDDGGGLPPEVREKGQRSGHFGLRGMRERAERIGGRMTIATGPGQGTEISVQLPARAAYAGRLEPKGWREWWRRMRTDRT